MFGLSASHLFIVFIVLLLFGSRRLPELGSSLGKTLNAFKKGLEGQDGNDPNQPAKQIADRDDSGKPKA